MSSNFIGNLLSFNFSGIRGLISVLVSFLKLFFGYFGAFFGLNYPKDAILLWLWTILLCYATDFRRYCGFDFCRINDCCIPTTGTLKTSKICFRTDDKIDWWNWSVFYFTLDPGGSLFDCGESILCLHRYPKV